MVGWEDGDRGREMGEGCCGEVAEAEEGGGEVGCFLLRGRVWGGRGRWAPS